MNDVVISPMFAYIDVFNGLFAIVGRSEGEDNIWDLKYGLIDCFGEIVLPLEHDNINKWENDYYLANKNNKYILLSPNLHPIIESDNRLKRLDDRFILKVDSSGRHGYRYGLIDYNGNEIIPMDEEHSFSEIEVLKNGFLKVIYDKGEYGSSHIGILNNHGDTILERKDCCDDITLLDNGFIIVKCNCYF